MSVLSAETTEAIRRLALRSAYVGVRETGNERTRARRRSIGSELRAILSIRETEGKTYVRALRFFEEAAHRCSCGDPAGVIVYGPEQHSSHTDSRYRHVRYGCACDGPILSEYAPLSSMITELLVKGAEEDARWTREPALSRERVAEIMADASLDVTSLMRPKP